MSVCLIPNSDGFLAVTDTSLEDCGDSSGYIGITVDEYNTLSSYTQITAADAGSAFSFGFFAVFAVGYLSTYAIKIAIRLIRTI
ncbi:single-stranded DNA-binding protein [Vibrio nitrifigilis]|uniref:Single-stranded DNA-binding protein n=1 Tax=Vibrio nitrifigilis TaxID=2789781 RepID=A0ABS0GGM0_9VIBR|nr:single-stranded DNA-binding protein [Vibrio nitrifigilis]MBF9000487.1 single-stranded DNA-binding protein [Vibrio nitrifigilis]MBF9001576.1 single-stranded DNA-binding protein [Vibrio nitrifigilis]MBF9002644.1 single-stranded DNA-binding protein [Vibrio nitrifigilis]